MFPVILQFLIYALCVVCKTTQCLSEHAIYLVSQNQEHYARSPYVGISQIKSPATIIPEKIIILECTALVWQYLRHLGSVDSNNI